MGVGYKFPRDLRRACVCVPVAVNACACLRIRVSPCVSVKHVRMNSAQRLLPHWHRATYLNSSWASASTWPVMAMTGYRGRGPGSRMMSTPWMPGMRMSSSMTSAGWPSAMNAAASCPVAPQPDGQQAHGQRKSTKHRRLERRCAEQLGMLQQRTCTHCCQVHASSPPPRMSLIQFCTQPHSGRTTHWQPRGATAQHVPSLITVTWLGGMPNLPSMRTPSRQLAPSSSTNTTRSAARAAAAAACGGSPWEVGTPVEG